MMYIANQIDTNIRELEGALIRVVAYSSLTNQDVSSHLAAEALKDIIPSSRPKMITIQDIQQKVGEYYSLKLEDFKARKRTKAVAFPRQIAMYLSRELTDFSLPKIGRLLEDEIIPRSFMPMKKSLKRSRTIKISIKLSTT